MLTVVYLAIAGALVALVAMAGFYFVRRSGENKTWATLSRAWVVLQAVVAHVEARIRPDVVKALEDGKLTTDERRALQATALELAKQAMADQLPAIAAAFRLGTPGAVDIFLSGLLERAYLVMKGQASATVAVSPGTPTPVTVSSTGHLVPVVPR